MMAGSERERSRQRARAVVRALAREQAKYAEPAVGKPGVTDHDPFRMLVAAVISARTRDTVTGPAAQRLFQRARTPRALLALSPRTVERCIAPVGMYHTKARHLRSLARMLLRIHGGQVPRSRAALLSLPGVGPKVANLVLGLAFHIPAICVDTHVHRVSNRLGLVRTRTPIDTERALARVLPKQLWISWNTLLVTWGQNVCLPRSPRCSQCVLRQRLCPQVGVTQFR